MAFLHNSMSTVQYKYDITYTVLLSDNLVVGDQWVKKNVVYLD
jgi:hypothetical protein